MHAWPNAEADTRRLQLTLIDRATQSG